jgi:hypothetical protein
MSKKTDNSKDQLTTLLKEFSLKEIISIFSNIDNKIMSMHKCSSEDFLNLNNHLKVYYKEAGKISANAQKIFNVFTGKDNQRIYNEFSSFYELLTLRVEYFEEELDHSTGILNKILNNLNNTFVPMKNFGQNLMSLKFLVTNLKFNINTNKESGKKLSKELNQIIGLIDKIKSSFPIFDENLNDLKSTINHAHKTLENIRVNTTADVEIILEKIRTNIEFLSIKHKEALQELPKLKEKTESCNNGISKIITNLQYQDIIRQKMDNFQETYKGLIQELNLLDENQNDKIILFKQAKYASQIPYIAELQIAQLIQTNKEYQSAIQIITNQFHEIGEDMKIIAEMCSQISSYTSTSGETHFNDILSKLKDTTDIIQQFSDANDDFKNSIQTINQSINSIVDNFDHILELDTRLQKLALETIITSEEERNGDEIFKISGQLKSLSKDLRLNINQCQYLFDQAINLGKELKIKLPKDYNLKDQQVNFSQNMNKILSSIENENKKVLDLLKENETISNAVSEKIKKSVEEVKYYDFFEKNIEEIILELNDTYQKLSNKYDDIKQAQKAHKLEDIERIYTTKSERDIHHNLTIEEENQEEDKEDDDNIEFF